MGDADETKRMWDKWYPILTQSYERAEMLSRLIIDQPQSEKEDPIQWGWTLPGWLTLSDGIIGRI